MNVKKVLIVDDSKTSQMITKRCLKIAGLGETEFLFAEDGVAALAALAEGPVDLILTDLNMPRMSGSVFIERLGDDDRTRRIPVIIVSSMSEACDSRSMPQVKGTLKKPITPGKVMRALNDIGAML